MKSRTSFFNGALFRKDVTRFAPAWVLYTIFLLLLTLTQGGTKPVNTARDLGYMINAFSIYHLVYALLVAQLLFGDLFNSRMCNALHALPMRRETWFGTHLTAGICFALIPGLLVSLLMLPFLGDFRIVALYYFFVMAASYLFYFGAAVLAVFCVGNRFAMVVVYGIINFLSVLFCLFITQIYDPLLFGIDLDVSWLAWLCPLAQLVEFSFVRVNQYTASEMLELGLTKSIVIETEGFWYLWILAAVGVVAIITALLLYRRRKLECAGDFVVVKPLTVVFLVLYTVAAGLLLHVLFPNIFYIFLLLGCAIGFFTGLMLLKRTTRVFTKKAWAGFGIFVAVLSLSMVLTVLDPIGFTRYVPKSGEVKTATLTTAYGNGDTFQTERVGEIEDLTAIHRHGIEQHLGDSYAHTVTRNEGMLVYLTYELNDGSTVRRNYWIYTYDEIGQLVKHYLSRPETVFGSDYGSAADFAARIERVSLENDNYLYQPEEILGLIEAMEADCLEGNLAYNSEFHKDHFSIWGDFELTVGKNETQYDQRYRSFRIWSDCTHTMQWLRDNGFPIEDSGLGERYDKLP